MSDKLDTMISMQDNLNKRFGASREELLALPEEERLEWVRKYIAVAHVELGEALLAAKGRWWKKDKDWEGWDHLKSEAVDICHFILSICLATGMDSQELFDRYCAKNAKNHTRPDWKINETPTL